MSKKAIEVKGQASPSGSGENVSEKTPLIGGKVSSSGSLSLMTFKILILKYFVTLYLWYIMLYVFCDLLELEHFLLQFST